MKEIIIEFNSNLPSIFNSNYIFSFTDAGNDAKNLGENTRKKKK